VRGGTEGKAVSLTVAAVGGAAVGTPVSAVLVGLAGISAAELTISAAARLTAVGARDEVPVGVAVGGRGVGEAVGVGVDVEIEVGVGEWVGMTGAEVRVLVAVA
jgi:hypothetical protein